MSESTFQRLLVAVVAAALESGLHPSLIHGALAVAGMELDDDRMGEPEYPEEDLPF